MSTYQTTTREDGTTVVYDARNNRTIAECASVECAHRIQAAHNAPFFTADDLAAFAAHKSHR